MIDLDTLAVIVVVGAAVIVSLRKLYRDIRGQASCSCGGCGGCGQAPSCGGDKTPPKKH